MVEKGQPLQLFVSCINQGRHNVQSKLQRAVARGLVTRSTSCSVNDKNCAGVIHGHHEDYSKPFEVIWLCRFHHKERHRKKD